MKGLGGKLRKLRMQRELTMRELGELVHISTSFVSDIEHGRGQPSLDTLTALAQVLEVPITELLEEEALLNREKETRAHHRIAEMISELSPEEEKDVLEYLEFIHVRRIIGKGKKESSVTSENTA